MSGAKVHIVITDHGPQRKEPPHTLIGISLNNNRFSGYLLTNPAISANADSEEEVVGRIMDALKKSSTPGSRRIVEVDVGDSMLAEDVLEG